MSCGWKPTRFSSVTRNDKWHSNALAAVSSARIRFKWLLVYPLYRQNWCIWKTCAQSPSRPCAIWALSGVFGGGDTESLVIYNAIHAQHQTKVHFVAICESTIRTNALFPRWHGRAEKSEQMFETHSEHVPWILIFLVGGVCILCCPLDHTAATAECAEIKVNGRILLWIIWNHISLGFMQRIRWRCTTASIPRKKILLRLTA